ncbi:MAG: alpha/beta hydrolase, partial [Saprospiraceae bacterium]|nr:alpha/beta hydrolase [Saprospiraceae bacterium]
MKRKLFKTLLISGLLILLLPLTTVVVLRKPNPKLLTNHQQNQVFLPTEDGKALMGCVFLPAEQPKANIIFLHGIRGNYGHFYKTAQDFQQRGYNCMLVNLRGHGNSGDLTTSYGFREKHDMNEIASFLATKNDLPTGIWGTSLGGAVGLQALGEYPDEFAFGVIESTFTTLHEVVFDYFSKFTTIQNKNISNWLINTAATYTAFDPVAVQPERSAKHIQCPVFMA